MIALGVLWGLQFPIIKNIWTSSYVLMCGGLSALLLGAFHSHRCLGSEELGHNLHLDRGKRNHALPHQRDRRLPAARYAANRWRRGQLCGQSSDARRGEPSCPCRWTAARGGAGRLLI